MYYSIDATRTHTLEQLSVVDTFTFYEGYEKEDDLIDYSKTAKPQPQSTKDVHRAGEEACRVEVEPICAIAAVESTFW